MTKLATRRHVMIYIGTLHNGCLKWEERGSHEEYNISGVTVFVLEERLGWDWK